MVSVKLHGVFENYLKTDWQLNVSSVSEIFDAIDVIKFDDEKTYTENLRCAIKNYIEINPSNNKYMNVSEWLKITGLCGFKNKTTYHYTLMTYLVKNKFMERSNNKLQMLVL